MFGTLCNIFLSKKKMCLDRMVHNKIFQNAKYVSIIKKDDFIKNMYNFFL